MSATASGFATPQEGQSAAQRALSGGDVAGARAIWAALRGRFPDSVAFYAEEALALVRLRQYAEADALQLAALERFPDLPGLWNDHAWTAFFGGDVAVAIERWQAMRARFPDRPEGYEYAARALRQAGRNDEAEAITEAALPRFTDRAQLWIEHAEAALQRGDVGEAMRRWESVLQRFAAQEDCYKLGTRVLAQVNRLPAPREAAGPALALLEDAKRRHPDLVDPFRLQAELLARIGDTAAALEAVRAAPLAGVTRADLVDMVFRDLRLEVYLAAAGTVPQFREPPATEPLEQAVAVMMIRDEADIIGQNLRHHYRMGLRKFAILLNCCSDATGRIVEQFRSAHPDVVLCTLTDPEPAYYQAGKTQAAIAFARGYFAALRRPAEWCFVLDADEFISVDGDLGLAGLLAGAEAAGKDFVTFHFCNGTSSAGDDLPADGDIYRFFDVIVGCVVPVVTKNAFRLSLDGEINMGNHALWYAGLAADRSLVAARSGARFIHLPYRSRAQLRTKLINGGTAYEATDLDREQGGHWRRPYQRLMREGDALLEQQMRWFHDKTLRDAARQAPFAF